MTQHYFFVLFSNFSLSETKLQSPE